MQVLGTLEPKEFRAITLRYDLNRENQKDYHTIAEILKCTEDEAKVYEAQGLTKLRDPSWSDALPSLFGWKNNSQYAKMPHTHD